SASRRSAAELSKRITTSPAFTAAPLGARKTICKSPALRGAAIGIVRRARTSPRIDRTSMNSPRTTVAVSTPAPAEADGPHTNQPAPPISATMAPRPQMRAGRRVGLPRGTRALLRQQIDGGRRCGRDLAVLRVEVEERREVAALRRERAAGRDRRDLPQPPGVAA